MISILNRKKLLVEHDPEKLSQFENKLKENNISYFIKTTCAEGFFGRTANVKTALHSSNCLSYNSVSFQNYIYYVYVRKADLLRAKKAIS